MVHAAELDDKHAVGQPFGLAAEQAREADPVELCAGRHLQTAQIHQRRQDVLALGQCADVAGGTQVARRPADEAGHAVPAVVEVAFCPACRR